MKNKINLIKYIAMIIAFVIPLITTIACTPIQGGLYDNNRFFENTVLSKDNCIKRAKELLNVNSIYYFDCDFTEMETVNITDISYNIYVVGKSIENENNKIALNLEERVEFNIITNYRIVNTDKSFGFSLVSSIMCPQKDHYKYEEIIETTPNIIYNETSFENISDLQYGGRTTYMNNTNTYKINTPQEFYPNKLRPNAYSIQYQYLWTNGPMSTWNDYKLYDTVISIFIHFNSAEDAQQSEKIEDEILDFLKNNVQYCKH